MTRTKSRLTKRSARFIENARAGRIKLDEVMKNVDYEIVSGGGSIIGEFTYVGTEEEATRAIKEMLTRSSSRHKLA